MKRLYNVRLSFRTLDNNTCIEQFYAYAFNSCHAVNICIKFLIESNSDFSTYYLIDTSCLLVPNFLK